MNGYAEVVWNVCVYEVVVEEWFGLFVMGINGFMCGRCAVCID